MDNLKPEMDNFKPRTWPSVTEFFAKRLMNNRGEVGAPPVDPPAAPPADPPPVDPPPAAPPATPPPAVANWYDGFSQDLKDNPTVQKFDTPESMTKSYLELSTLLGNEKVALPKDENDHIAIKNLNKALRVPEEASGYQIEAPAPIPGMEQAQFDMDGFKSMAHKRNLTPDQAKGVLEDYMSILTDIKAKSTQSHVDSVNTSKEALTKEWGIAYNTKVALAQSVMNKFSGSKENFEHINALIGADPVALKWMATIGEQFSEGSLGNLGDPKPGFTKTPSEAKAEYDAIMTDTEDIYWAGVRNKKVVPESIRIERVKYVESLLQMQQGQAPQAP